MHVNVQYFKTLGQYSPSVVIMGFKKIGCMCCRQKKIENQPTRLKNFNLNLILTCNTYVYTCS